MKEGYIFLEPTLSHPWVQNLHPIMGLYFYEFANQQCMQRNVSSYNSERLRIADIPCV